MRVWLGRLGLLTTCAILPGCDESGQVADPEPLADLPASDDTSPGSQLSIADNAHLKKQPEMVKRWRNGFFNLPWALVKEFHEEGFLWGATFSSPDLHHFEL